MIILRKLKLFSIVTPFPNNLKKDYSFNESLAESCDEVIIDIQQTDTFRDQFEKSSETNRDKVRKFWQDLKTNCDSWFSDVQGDIDVNTHFLGNKSKINTHILSDRFVMFSKDINGKHGEDRFNYRVYLPTIVIDNKTGKKTYYQKIVLATCYEHTNNGEPGAYVKGQIGNTWHPKSKSTRNKIKQKKLDNKNKS